MNSPKRQSYKQKKKQKRVNKKSWITDIPIGVCIFFIVSGIAFVGIFAIGPWYWGKPIDRNEAIHVSAVFDSYTEHHNSGSVSQVKVHFLDRDNLWIDGACYTADVESAVKTIKSGDELELLLHPNSEDIWEMKNGERVIISFEESKNKMVAENIVFSAVIGGFGAVSAVLGCVSLADRFWKRRKQTESTMRR